MRCMLYQKEKRRRKNITAEDRRIFSEAVHYLKLDEIYGRVHEMMPGTSKEGAAYSRRPCAKKRG